MTLRARRAQEPGKGRRGESGFGLVDLLIGGGILAIALVGVTVMAHGIATGAHASMRSLALQASVQPSIEQAQTVMAYDQPAAASLVGGSTSTVTLQTVEAGKVTLMLTPGSNGTASLTATPVSGRYESTVAALTAANTVPDPNATPVVTATALPAGTPPTPMPWMGPTPPPMPWTGPTPTPIPGTVWCPQGGCPLP